MPLEQLGLAGIAIGLAIAVVMLFVSFWLAQIASGTDGCWGWGLLGPVGWIIAAVRGVQIRLDRPQVVRTKPVVEGPPPATCGKCRAKVPAYRTVCPECGAPME